MAVEALKRTADIESAGPSLEQFRTIFADIARGAGQRDAERIAPFAEVAALKQAGFGAVRLPPAEGGLGLTFVELMDLVVELARAGKRVLRLKGGDPFMFGRGGEEAGALARAGVKFRIVPGISSGLGGLAYAGIPVTHRDTNHAVIFLTGHDETGELPQSVDWAAVATAAPVIVMFMAVKHLGAIADMLVAAGRDPADRLAVVSHAALPGQIVVESTLGRAAELSGLETPALVVLGPVSRYREVLDWYTPDLRANALG